MQVTVEKKEKYVLLKLQEEKLNSIVAPELKSELLMLSTQGNKNLIVDLSETRYCDSSGLSAILVGNRLCKNVEGSFVVTGLQDAVNKMIAISQLDKVLSIVPTLDEAVDLVYMEEIERDLRKKKK